MMVSSGSKLVKSLTLNREMTGRQKKSKASKKVPMRVYPQGGPPKWTKWVDPKVHPKLGLKGGTKIKLGCPLTQNWLKVRH